MGVDALLDLNANLFSHNTWNEIPSDLAAIGGAAWCSMYFFNDAYPTKNTYDTTTPPSRTLDWNGEPHGYTDQQEAEKVAYYGTSSNRGTEVPRLQENVTP